MPSPLYLLVFLTTLLALEGVYFLLQDLRTRRTPAVRRRLHAIASGLDPVTENEEESVLRTHQGSRTERLLRRLPTARVLEVRLYRAGMTTRLHVFVAGSAALGFGAWLVVSILLNSGFLALPALATAALPWLNVLRRARARTQQFEEQFLEGLELLTRALRAGHSLALGLQMIGEELPDPIGSEFAYVSEEIKHGQDIRTALFNLSYRVDTPDLPFFVTAVLIQRETGGNLAEILENLDHVIRERFKLYGKIRSLTAISVASANLLAAWPLFIVAVLSYANVDYIAPLWETTAGQGIAMISAGLVFLGYIGCRRMAQIVV